MGLISSHKNIDIMSFAQPDIEIDRLNALAAAPVKMTTSARYLIALTDIYETLIKTGDRDVFNLSSIASKYRISKSFGSACLELKIVRRYRNGSRRFYKWDLDGPPTALSADMVRNWINVYTRGTQPKFEKLATVRTTEPTATPTVRKRLENAPKSIAKNGVVSKNHVMDEIQGSFFKKLCPECAETMIQFITMITQKNQ